MEDQKLTIKYSAEKAEKKANRVLRFIGSDEKVDRDNERILSEGWKLANYKKNPVVLVNHRAFDGLPVARTKKVWVDNKKLMFDIEFPEADVSPQGDTLFKLYSNGYMKATSVGFIPNRDKIIWGEKKGEPRITFQEQELLEISLVSVPANAGALLTNKGIQKAIKDEVIDELELKDLELALKDYFDEVKTDESQNSDEKVADNPEKDTKLSEKDENDDSNDSKSKENISTNSKEELSEEEIFFKGLYDNLNVPEELTEDEVLAKSIYDKLLKGE